VADEKLAGQLKEKLITRPRKTVMVLQLLDNSIFFAHTEEGSLTPCRSEALSSRYHAKMGTQSDIRDERYRTEGDENRHIMLDMGLNFCLISEIGIFR
jgi:hypothetical protein